MGKYGPSESKSPSASRNTPQNVQVYPGGEVPYQGPGFGPGGDVGLDTSENWQISNMGGIVKPHGKRYDYKTGKMVDWGNSDGGARRSSGGGGGRGGAGGGQAAYSPIDIGQLKDRFSQMTMELTGMTPEQMGTSFEWYKPKWEGGWSQGDFERYYRGTEVFKKAYPGIDEATGIDQYESEARQLNNLSLEARGGKGIKDEELRQYMDTGEVPF